jgi:hypothetical protein
VVRNLLPLFLLVQLSCTSSVAFRRGLVSQRAAFELQCENVSVTPLGGDAYGAAGCGKRSVYVVECSGGAARRDLCTALAQDHDKAP